VKALAVSSAAAAGCAGARPELAGPGEAGAAPGGRPDPAPSPGAAVAEVRAFKVPAEADPALVFRAPAARPGDPR
jgi:hypothetical protein